MSVLIPGMEMPKACFGCPMDSDYGECLAIWDIEQRTAETFENKRRDDCPLREVGEMPKREFAEWVRGLLTFNGKPAEEMIDKSWDGKNSIIIEKIQREDTND